MEHKAAVSFEAFLNTKRALKHSLLLVFESFYSTTMTRNLDRRVCVQDARQN